LRCGLREHRDDDACIIALGDQPFVKTADIDLLISTWAEQRPAGDELTSRRRKPPIVALRAGDVWGSPVLFPRDDFAALLRLAGDRGAKKYAAAQKDRLAFVAASDARAFHDVDTVADLTRLI
jgi:CTP:molybdopterin cytidylyltransferase MocA